MWTRRKKNWLSRLALALIAVCLFVYVIWPLVWQLGFGLPGHADFYLNQSKYEVIVAKAKALPLEPGAQIRTRVDGLTVDVRRSPEGPYTMTITTVDWHHAGTYGYVFSDTPLTPHPNENYSDYLSVDNPGDMPFLDSGISGQGGRWWSVYNNLL